MGRVSHRQNPRWSGRVGAEATSRASGSLRAGRYSDWKVGARVSIDYHIELHGHYYSAPYALIHEHVDARLTATTVEIFHRGQRVAAHRRSVVRGQHITDPKVVSILAEEELTAAVA